MKEDSPSLTAEGIAILRENEMRKPASERLFEDPYARYFVRPWLAWVTRLIMSLGYADWRGPGVIGFLLARTRYMDETLLSCLQQGIQQLVILGAGYDARPYRFQDQLKGRVQVFEVDHPATQRVKVDKLKKVFSKLPEHVTYVPVDFDRESLKERLLNSGYQEDLLTLFIWEGVTYYITPQAVDDTLAFVRQHSAAGSWIVFDYTYQEVVDGTYKRGEATNLRRYRGLTGEGMVFGIPEGTIESFLRARGFREIQKASGGDLERAYFSKQNGYNVARVYAIAVARV
jgi:methyltransferase (TIGR00027 family)